MEESRKVEKKTNEDQDWKRKESRIKPRFLLRRFFGRVFKPGGCRGHFIMFVPGIVVGGLLGSASHPGPWTNAGSKRILEEAAKRRIPETICEFSSSSSSSSIVSRFAQYFIVQLHARKQGRV